MGIAKFKINIPTNGGWRFTVQHLSEALAAMPNGTRILNIEKQNANDLYTPYEIILFHEYFEDCSEIEAQYSRKIAWVDDKPHEIDSFNGLDIKYKKRT